MTYPKGKLIAIGGNVDKGTDPEGAANYHVVNFFSSGILKRIITESRKGIDSQIEVITTASMIPEEVGKSYEEAFRRLGCPNVGQLHIRNREDAQRAEYVERVAKADTVMFTGGNQLRLSSIFGGTEVARTLKRKYQQEVFLIAGTSAGAMVMSNPMIYGGESHESLMKGEVHITTGLGLIENVIIDTHFVKRGRFGRLAQSVAANPGCLGIGLGDDTGVLIQNGHHIETVGSGLVLMFDGHSIGHTNIADLPEGYPIAIENLIVHVLAKGYMYDIESRKFIPTLEPVIDDAD
jgi:cyanophycinase